MSKREDPAAKLAAKQRTWRTRTEQILQLPSEETLPLLQMARKQSIRLNPLRGEVSTTAAELTKLGWLGAPYTWAAHCYDLNVPVEQIRDHELITSGKVFIQNAASWLPVIALDPQPGEKILDLCAAPGGKTSHIAAITNNQAYITANDNSRPRLAKMQANFGRLDVTPAQISLYDATQIGRKLDSDTYDKILLDAPCSGEGLMHYDRAKDFESWSVAHIKRLSKLQKQILGQAWYLLKVGGTLVYSTCTMAPEENEVVVDYLLRTHPEAQVLPFDLPLSNRVPALSGWNDRAFQPQLQGSMRLVPSQHIEAFFVCVLRKTADINATTVASGRHMRYDDD